MCEWSSERKEEIKGERRERERESLIYGLSHRTCYLLYYSYQRSKRTLVRSTVFLLILLLLFLSHVASSYSLLLFFVFFLCVFSCLSLLCTIRVTKYCIHINIRYTRHSLTLRHSTQLLFMVVCSVVVLSRLSLFSFLSSSLLFASSCVIGAFYSKNASVTALFSGDFGGFNLPILRAHRKGHTGENSHHF